MAKDYGLLISGAGDLGLRIARKYLQTSTPQKLNFGDILCETLSTRSHDYLRSAGLKTRLSSDLPDRADRLIIAFPPGEDYFEQVSRAIQEWNRKGPGLLISTTGVYLEDGGGVVDVDSPVDTYSPIVKAERLALESGLHVLRLAGLYERRSGPHTYWHRKKKIDMPAKGLINLIHRQDAADAAFRLMISDLKPALWVLSDGFPLARNQIAQAWAQHLNEEAATFIETSSLITGKRVSAEKLLKALQWEPRYKGFLDFVDAQENPRNVLGSKLKTCCMRPLTGFFRDGTCRTSEEDRGAHTICVEATEKFLNFSKSKGNDLSTPRPDLQFEGVKEGNRWCLCASRWIEAWQAGEAPRIYLESTHEQMLEWIELDVLKGFALDLA